MRAHRGGRAMRLERIDGLLADASWQVLSSHARVLRPSSLSRSHRLSPQPLSSLPPRSDGPPASRLARRLWSVTLWLLSLASVADGPPPYLDSVQHPLVGPSSSAHLQPQPTRLTGPPPPPAHLPQRDDRGAAHARHVRGRPRPADPVSPLPSPPSLAPSPNSRARAEPSPSLGPPPTLSASPSTQTPAAQRALAS